MSRHGVAFAVLVFAVAACGSTEPEGDGGFADSTDDPLTDPPVSRVSVTEPTDDALVLHQDGIGGIRLERERQSLSVTDVETWLGTDLALNPQTDSCALGINEDLGIAVMYDHDTGVLGFVFDNSQVTTSEGIGVGSTVEDVAAAYGRGAAVLSEVVSQTGGPLVLVSDADFPEAPPGPRTLHLAFDSDEAGKVTRLRAGFWPWVAYRDYCSAEDGKRWHTGWPLVEP